MPHDTLKWGSKELTTRVKYGVLGTKNVPGSVKNRVYGTTKQLKRWGNEVMGTAHNYTMYTYLQEVTRIVLTVTLYSPSIAIARALLQALYCS